MKAKNQQPYILGDDLESREEVEVHEQRIKELEEYNGQEDKSYNSKIIIFTSILLFTLTIIFYVVRQANKNNTLR
ncbi:hypothetical protein BU116_08755 [Staphylococcus xylosus]|uniref:hypothetical protein n=1 Tax=Staphylococcus TaxID=1279 RepID=UPI000E69ABA4|nr:hypothetical protein [Staphylococcus xylosus]RIM77187.1 hypothetical protein BU116_08755 [Staphylococcus xylosus]